MRKMTYALAFLVALLTGTQWAKADTVSPYSVDFDTKIATSDHDFKVATGWGHVVGTYEDDWTTSYISYSWGESYGKDSTGGLKIPKQTGLGSGWGSGETTTDLLVTPAVSGTVTLDVKKYTNSSSIKFYTVTKSGATYTQGSEITVETSELSTSDFTTLTIPVDDNTYIGIWGNNVYIDNFTATSADIELSKALTITSAKNIGGTNAYCDENNEFTITFSATIKNTGDVDLQPGDEGYSLSIINSSASNAVVGTKDITKALAVGESLTDTITVKVSADTYPNRNRYDIQEDITGSIYKVYAWMDVIPYKPILELRNDGSSVDSLSTFNYGMVNTATSKSFTVRNKGGKALNVTSISVPEGFSVDLATPFSVAAGKDSVFTVTLLAETAGIYSGELVITADEISPFRVYVKGTVLDPSKFYATFNDGQIPAGCVAESNWSVAQRDYLSSENPYMLANSQSTPETKFITPLLRVAEGEKMTFDVARGSTYASSCSLNVYYSADRKNWTLAKTITKEELSSTKPVSNYYYGALTSFELDNVPAGEYYIGFGAGYVGLDNIYGFEVVDVAHDWLVSESKLPTTGMVNNAYTATATLKNLNTKAEEAGSYTATLYVDGKAVATAEAVAIEANSEQEFSFAYTPHTNGTFPAYVEFANATDGYKAVSDTATVTITEESASVDIQVGEQYSSSASKKAPISPNYKHSVSDAIYTAETLNAVGLKAGDKIAKIYYKGYNTASELAIDELKSWIANTEEETFPSTYEAFPNTDEMTSIYNDAYTIPLAGSSNDHAAVLEFPLAEPFVYDGHALRIFTQHDASTYKSISLEYTNDKEHAYGAQNDNRALEASDMSKNELPVLYLSVVRESPVFSGTVTDGDDAVAGATVTLTSGDVIYTTTTDEQGAYSLTVIQSDKKYALTVEAEDYEPYAEADSVDVTTTTTKDITLTLKPVTVTLEDGVWATFSSKKSVDFAETDINAYIVTAVSGENATLQRVTSIPANTGVLLYGNGTYTLPEAPEAVAPEANLLVPTAKAAYTVPAEDEGKAYTFDNNYFTKAAIGDVVAKKHAYLLAEGGDNAVYLVLPKVTFSGTVTDGTKAIAGATVTLTDKNSQPLTVTTDAEGKFSQSVDQTNLKYLVSAEAMGYDAYTATDSIPALADTVLAIVLNRQPVTVTVPASGWTTFSSIFPVSFGEDVKAYIVNDYADGKATIVSVTEAPAYTGVVINAAEGTHTLSVVDEAAAVEGNLLGNTAAASLDITADNADSVYPFAEVSGEPGFAKASAGTTIAQGQAYLPVSDTTDEWFALYDPTTGISLATSADSQLDESQPMYNLSGQRVAKSYHGVVVQNGKKFIRK